MEEKLKPEQQALRSRVSANVKRLRNAQKISQEGLADLAGLHRTYVSQVERMVVNTSMDNIALLATALGCDFCELFAKVETSTQNAPPVAPVAEKTRHRTFRKKT
ncbi:MULTISPECIES: helix-turn-helix domain-containing protein [unclassified Caballeronia]|uniref:helix-turn-helix domain-containing protein n=1 Tax=unclassified Caballeronia TaxID=2646786 RepID=UPI002028E52F|nr:MULTISPECIES: helix-turn-helix transcriptional regulator [unclassified Caballeronia]MDR5765903.1 helix-turn-helix transcriptional regulator [Caballeronia sp. LZ028]